MVDLSVLEARQSPPTLYSDDLLSRSSRHDNNINNNNDSSSSHNSNHNIDDVDDYYGNDHHEEATTMNPYRSRDEASSLRVSQKLRHRKRRDIINPNALQELDDTVASIGSHRGGGGGGGGGRTMGGAGTSWNDGDSVSQSSHTIATHEGHNNINATPTTTHRSLIANMRDIKDMRGRTLPNPYVVGPRSVSSRRSKGSRASHISRRSSRRNDALERMVSLTLMETATLDEGESHFLSIAEDDSHQSVLTADDILNDLITVSTIVEHETRSQRGDASSSGSSSSRRSNPARKSKPKNLLPNASGDSGELSYDHVDYDAPSPKTVKPIFFKLQKQAQQTIPEEESPRAYHHTANHAPPMHPSPGAPFSAHYSPSGPSRGSPVYPLATQQQQPRMVMMMMQETQRRTPSPGPSPIVRQARSTVRPMDPPAVSPRQLFQPTLASDDGFPSIPTGEDTPVGNSVESFFQSQMEQPSEFPSEWSHTEWTTFENADSPFVAASPSSVVDAFRSRINPTASTDSGMGSKYSI